jgi:hypothetical protein
MFLCELYKVDGFSRKEKGILQREGGKVSWCRSSAHEGEADRLAALKSMRNSS